MTKTIDEHVGKKYKRVIYPAGQVVVHKKCDLIGLEVDVYCVLKAFKVTDGPVAHAVKKLLCLGQRGKGDKLQDLVDVEAAVSRAIEMEKQERERMKDFELAGQWTCEVKLQVPIDPNPKELTPEEKAKAEVIEKIIYEQPEQYKAVSEAATMFAYKREPEQTPTKPKKLKPKKRKAKK